jgi:hypothetical protein
MDEMEIFFEIKNKFEIRNRIVLFTRSQILLTVGQNMKINSLPSQKNRYRRQKGTVQTGLKHTKSVKYQFFVFFYGFLYRILYHNNLFY